MRDLQLCLDPGHGGSNLGICANGIIEKDYTMAVGDELFDSLSMLPLDLWMTRYEDKDINQAERGRDSEDADLVLSLHVNASEDRLRSGFEIFHWPGNQVGLDIAKHLRSRLPWWIASSRIYESDDRWPGVLEVLGAHSATTVLIEMGYATNETDAEKLQSRWHRSEIVSQIRSVICHWGDVSERGIL